MSSSDDASVAEKVQGQLRRDKTSILVFDPVFQAGKRRTFLGPQFREETIVVRLIEGQIVFVSAQKVQRAQGCRT